MAIPNTTCNNTVDVAPARVFALIPCAGAGSRAKTAAASSPKQYQLLLGQAMVMHTVNAFRALGLLGRPLAGLCVVVSASDAHFSTACPTFGQPGEALLACGGHTRAQTVRNGLQALLAASPSNGLATARAGDWVLVHDAARCLVTPEQIARLLDACSGDEVGGLLAHPLADTLKCGTDGRVRSTLDRSDKFLAQTPQMFRIGALLAALQAAGEQVTDESSAMEAAGFMPRLVAGSAQNFKVTFAEDFALAEAVLSARRAALSA